MQRNLQLVRIYTNYDLSIESPFNFVIYSVQAHRGAHSTGKKCEIHTMKFAIAPLNPQYIHTISILYP